MSGGCIEFTNVTRRYTLPSKEEVLAVNGVTLTIREGEFVGVLGLNASGKSTLARLCNGLLLPTSGTVCVDGIDTNTAAGRDTIRRRVGLVFQNPDNQLVCPVVAEEVAFGPDNMGLPFDEVKRRVEWALELCDLAELRHQAPHELSGGQKQRVALASVLAMQPRYLVLDEPTSMIDVPGRHDLMEHLRMLNRREGTTVVLITHDPEDLIYADRVIVMDRGSIATQGAPKRVFRDLRFAALGFESPETYQLHDMLEASGYPLGDRIRTVQDLAEHLCRQ